MSAVDGPVAAVVSVSSTQPIALIRTQPGRRLNPLAVALAALPEVWLSLLIEHEPDGRGRCRACRSSGTPGPRWPCTLRIAAEGARELARYGPPAPRRPHDPA